MHIEKEIDSAEKQKMAAPFDIHQIMQSYQRFSNVLPFHGLFFFEAKCFDFPFLFDCQQCHFYCVKTAFCVLNFAGKWKSSKLPMHLALKAESCD